MKERETERERESEGKILASTPSSAHLLPKSVFSSFNFKDLQPSKLSVKLLVGKQYADREIARRTLGINLSGSYRDRDGVVSRY